MLLNCAPMDAIRFVPLCLLIISVLTGVVGRSWLQRRRYGKSGVPASPRHLGLLGIAEAMLPIWIIVQAILIAVNSDSLDAISLPGTSEVVPSLLGVPVILGSLMCLLLAQLQMGPSWRIGIVQNEKPGLVTTGLFRFVRNPIYTSAIGLLIGFCLLIPTWIMLGMTVAALGGFRLQIAREEEHLLHLYGDEYLAYGSRAGRFTPWGGRFHSPHASDLHAVAQPAHGPYL